MAVSFTEANELTVYTGPMFCGKTDRLLLDLEHYEYAGVPYIAFKPDFDTRSGNVISSRSGRKGVEAVIIEKAHPEQIFDHMNGHQVVAVDEIQFFAPYIAEVLHEIAGRGKHVVVSGLDTDFRRIPFEATARTMAYADRLEKLTAVCKATPGCRQRATLTQRYDPATGLPAPFSDEVELVQRDLVVRGTAAAPKELPTWDYRAACPSCYTIPGKPALDVLVLQVGDDIKAKWPAVSWYTRVALQHHS